MARLLLVSFLESLVWGALLLIVLVLMSGCHGVANEQDALGSILSGGVLVAAWAGVGGWYLRGWYDRRMRPGVPEPLQPSEETRMGQRWAASLAQIDRSVS